MASESRTKQATTAAASRLRRFRKMLPYRTALTAYRNVPRAASAVRSSFVAASLSGPPSGGRSATVHANQKPMATTIARRRSARRRMSASPSSGRRSTNAEPTAKKALTRRPTGIDTWKPACSPEKRMLCEELTSADFVSSTG
jgi:hypothetical protein